MPLFSVIFLVWYFEKQPRQNLFWNWLIGFAGGFLVMLVEGWFSGLWAPSWHFAGSLWHFFMTDFVYYLVPISAFFFWKGRFGEDRLDWLLAASAALSGLFTLLGLRDFVATRPHLDDIEFFLIPLFRMVLVVVLPLVLLEFRNSHSLQGRLTAGAKAGGIFLLISLLAVFRQMNFHFWVWLVVPGLVYLAWLWYEKEIRNR